MGVVAKGSDDGMDGSVQLEIEPRIVVVGDSELQVYLEHLVTVADDIAVKVFFFQVIGPGSGFLLVRGNILTVAVPGNHGGLLPAESCHGSEQQLPVRRGKGPAKESSQSKMIGNFVCMGGKMSLMTLGASPVKVVHFSGSHGNTKSSVDCGNECLVLKTHI